MSRILPPMHTFIAYGSIVEGNIRVQGNLYIEGTVEGTIEVEGDVRIGLQGMVRGEVVAQRVTITGRVEGDVYARESVFAKSTAFVIGKLDAPKIDAQAGALIEEFSGEIGVSESTLRTRDETPPSSELDVYIAETVPPPGKPKLPRDKTGSLSTGVD